MLQDDVWMSSNAGITIKWGPYIHVLHIWGAQITFTNVQSIHCTMMVSKYAKLTTNVLIYYITTS